LSSEITGNAITRAGGGGGALGSAYITTAAAGGSGGGGIGATKESINGGNGTSNTGSGGGGSSYTGQQGTLGTPGNGGSGVVILRYPNTATITIGSGLTGSTANVGSDKVTTITAGTGNVTWGG
jgi:hypothetical protein